MTAVATLPLYDGTIGAGKIFAPINLLSPLLVPMNQEPTKSITTHQSLLVQTPIERGRRGSKRRTSKENARDSGDEASGFGTGTLVTRDQRRDEEARSAGEAGGRRPPELERSAAERNGADGRPKCSEAR